MVVYRKDEYVLKTFSKGSRNEFIIINEKKKEKLGYKQSHTHIKSKEVGKYLIKLSCKGKINNGLSPYLLESLARISEDENYQQRVRNLIEVKKDRGVIGYRNKPVGMF